jgi:hypothetical protein
MLPTEYTLKLIVYLIQPATVLCAIIRKTAGKSEHQRLKTVRNEARGVDHSSCNRGGLASGLNQNS